MQTEEILRAIDEQIAHLQKARTLLSGIAVELNTGKRRGRPKGSLSKADVQTALSAAKAPGRKSKMSAEGRARIAKAQKARWAAQKKSAAGTDPSASGVAEKAGSKPGRKASAKTVPSESVDQTTSSDDQQ